MAHILIMPRQGNTVESCIIIGWRKKEGDLVQADTPVCEVETDKATFEVPAGNAGTLIKILYQEGDDVPVLQPIAVIGNAGEDWQAALGAEISPAAAPENAKQSESVTKDNIADVVSPTEPVIPNTVITVRSEAFTAISPRARNAAYEQAIDISHIQGTGPEGRIIESDIICAAQSREPLTLAAREAARMSKAVLPKTGSGIGGRVTLDDLAKISNQTAVPAVFAQETAANSDNEYTETPIKGIRKVIADKMCQSLATTAQFTLNASANAVKLQELRKRFKDSNAELGANGITINDLVLFAVSRMLLKYPFMNAHKKGTVLRTFNTVHLGVAVDTPRGLMVPVIKNAQRLSLKQISIQAKELAAACNNGTIKPEQLEGSTLTVTNLGNTGIESFTPVINIPEVAILGVCSILPKLNLTSDGTHEVLPHIPFSLTIDHSVVDGAPAAKFLAAFCDAVKNIDVLLAN